MIQFTEENIQKAVSDDKCLKSQMKVPDQKAVEQVAGVEPPLLNLTTSLSRKIDATSIQVQSMNSNVIGELGPDFQGILLESMSGPRCLIDEIDDLTKATVGLLKDAVIHCLNMADWVERHHIQLFYQGTPLLDDACLLDNYNIKEGASIKYVIMIV